ncbi:hypothetical protein [Entomobacter blattae]|uniref:Uncharacterized protein n=1 Tax=Entomobacter blattae TaxID=2762277 RepID=A0A7H1NT68_9PROT|nr:hypothetical protein [Entomobacter blattae]QNT78978.1 hypothetical protein JGUZn3_17610 [Entomobacter blattae]
MSVLYKTIVIFFLAFFSLAPAFGNTEDEVALAHKYLWAEVNILKLAPESVSTTCITAIRSIKRQEERMQNESPLVKFDILKTMYLSSIELCYPDIEYICHNDQRKTTQEACQDFFISRNGSHTVR